MAARSILDTLRVVQMADSHDEYTEVIDIFYRLSYDPEATVRVELMDSLPHIALLCHESWGMPKCILPVVVTYLHDSNNQVSCRCYLPTRLQQP
ncbi:PREDICTED: serine/threonine-protein phosphatase 4 regulatory subunit 1-like, partial [Priapulus caudatus]|uniref:Serine/threonine-protein phosphatase 4 regulatory subunit 1-like n=1 Tax=Priapulus caudatus TaxID=37621 RepID=A0ABM1F0G1_PRICU